MCSSVSPTPLFFPTTTRFLFPRCHFSLLNSARPILFTPTSINPNSRLPPSVAVSNVDVSWFSPEPAAIDDYGGWAIVETPALKKKNKKGLSPFLLVGIGSSIAALLAAIAHFSLSRRGIAVKFSSPVTALHGVIRLSALDKDVESKSTDYDALPADVVVPESNMEISNEANHIKRQEGKLGRIFVPVAMDSTQQEALLMLRKLKIIEDDFRADELCTRREYARWLVRENSLLERNPKHQITPSVALSGSIFGAFDDVSIEDPDFGSIQSLAEAGIILSKLSGKISSSDPDDSQGHEGVYFFPERFLSRQDLIDWKAQLEYETVPGIEEKISKTNMGFMDMREVSSDASTGLLVDMLAGDNSILRKVFGQGKRFQPNKPSTKSQAAVALTSGRMNKAIHAELSRLVAENISKQNEMVEIRSALLARGDIQRYWDGRLEEERSRAIEVERAYLSAIHDLEQEKIVQVNTIAQHLKEKAAIDCQKQLLSSLKEEVNQMTERLAADKAQHEDEQCNLKDLLSHSQAKLDGMLDTKSILEAEIESLRILRSWIEDEARKSQARVKVLEEVRRRWKWEDQP
ncbi:uncharacterized protein LOC131311170 isoform X2 [Rhododendron vialii]|uniref:uncharacterized protein LOC131311170 isoform X2 n=1 Tax=Rhododendron vialii TaxID=182163 RepID=UPI00265F158A|nr:uncharacterized protein LOC131311170 isoform X2 [Rhododendron vialii]